MFLRTNISTGFALIAEGDSDVLEAFELANEAMFIAQSRPKKDRIRRLEGTSNRNTVFRKDFLR